MPNSFEQRFQSRSVQSLNRTFGVEVSLSRGVETTKSFTARRNNKVYQALGYDFGIAVSITMRDFYLPAASLVLGELTVAPRTGDRIYEGDMVYEIQPPDDKTPSIELLPGEYEYLVHTKQVE